MTLPIKNATHKRLQCYVRQHILDKCQCLTTCLWWECLFLMAVSLSLEPAAFSVKTTPQTRNPKVTKPHFPPMSLTLQVTSHFHFQAHTPVQFFLFNLFLLLSALSLFHHVPLSLYASLYLTASNISFYPFHPFLSLSFSDTHTQSHKTIAPMTVCLMHKACWDGERWCVYLALWFVLSLKLYIHFTCVVWSEIIVWVLPLEPNNLL